MPPYTPRSDTEALSRDLVVLRARISDEVAEHLVSVTVDPGLLGPTARSMDRTSQFHPAMLAKWGSAIEDPGEANFLLPMKIIPQADPLTGTFSTSVKATDISGQEVELTDSSAPTVVVSDRRERVQRLSHARPQHHIHPPGVLYRPGGLH